MQHFDGAVPSSIVESQMSQEERVSKLIAWAENSCDLYNYNIY